MDPGEDSGTDDDDAREHWGLSEADLADASGNVNSQNLHLQRCNNHATPGFAEANAAVAAAIATRRTVSNLRSGSVPTEMLGPGMRLHDHNRGTPELCFRMIARRPCSTVLLMLSISVAAAIGLVLFGEVGISVQTTLFQDRFHPDVQRDKTLRQLAYTDARSKKLYSTKEIHGDPSPPPRPPPHPPQQPPGPPAPLAPLSSPPDPPGSPDNPLLLVPTDSTARCRKVRNDGVDVTVFQIVFSARNRQSVVLQPHILQRVLLVEHAIRRWVADTGVCGDTSESMAATFCEIPDSALNYVYPTVLPGQLRFDGLGFGSDTVITRAGAECRPAVLKTHIDSVVDWLVSTGRGGFFSSGEDSDFSSGEDSDFALACAQTSELTSTRCEAPRPVQYLRTRLAVPSERWRRLPASSANELISILHDGGQSPHLRIHSDLLHCNPALRAKQITGLIMRDALLLVSAIVMIMLYMVVYFGNVWLALLGVVQISISFPIMGFLVTVVFQQRPLSVRAVKRDFNLRARLYLHPLLTVRHTADMAGALRLCTLRRDGRII